MDIHLVTPQENITKIMIVGGELRVFVAKLTSWQFFFADMLIYTATRFLIRASIILFYLRVFPPGPDRKLGRILMWTFYANFVYNLGFFLAVLFQCTPIHHFWDHWEGLGNGHCGNVNILVWVAAITGIVFDLWLLALPFPQLMALNLHWKKKFMGIFMFGMGALVLIISLIRLKTINNFTRTSNPTSALLPLPPRGVPANPCAQGTLSTSSSGPALRCTSASSAPAFPASGCCSASCCRASSAPRQETTRWVTGRLPGPAR